MLFGAGSAGRERDRHDRGVGPDAADAPGEPLRIDAHVRQPPGQQLRAGVCVGHVRFSPAIRSIRTCLKGQTLCL